MKLTYDFEQLLPCDGALYLIRRYYKGETADQLFVTLLRELTWEQEQIVIYGKPVKVPRLMGWYGDEAARYHYSGTDHEPRPWTDTLANIRKQLAADFKLEFNSVMANLYRNGSDSMGCHADNEKELGPNPLIASLSFGEERLLKFRHNQSRQQVDVALGSGDLLLMAEEIQHHWKHELPKTKSIKTERINLTFRKIIKS